MRASHTPADAAASGTAPAGALYAGHVFHIRRAPKIHRLRYRIFSILVDIDRLDEITSSTWLFSRNRFNLYSFHDRDFGDRSKTPLRGQVDRLLAMAGLDLTGGHVSLLCMPRVLGYAFNPLSVYYCYADDNRLTALIYEVNNTFGQRHTYVMPVDPQQTASNGVQALIEQHCIKGFHVSPFLGLDMAYRFRVVPPSAELCVIIDVSQQAACGAAQSANREKDMFVVPKGQTGAAATAPILTATYRARRMPLTDRTLLFRFLTHPLLTLKVIVGIHWEALHLWRKGAQFRACPPAGQATTVVHVSALRCDDGQLAGYAPSTTSAIASGTGAAFQPVSSEMS